MVSATKRIGVIPHGTISKYSNHKCRCDACRAAWADYNREMHYTRAFNNRKYNVELDHGNYTTYYNHRCRCRACKDAAATYYRELRRRQRAASQVQNSQPKEEI